MTPAATASCLRGLGREAVALLQPRDGGVYVDATFGAGGYSRAILAVPRTRVGSASGSRPVGDYGWIPSG